VGGTDDFIVLPALTVTLFPGSVLIGGDAVPVGEGRAARFKKTQFVEQVTHCVTPACRPGCYWYAGSFAELASSLECASRIMIDLAQAIHGAGMGTGAEKYLFVGSLVVL